MIDEPGCRSGRRISASPAMRSRAHPAEVVGDLVQAHGDRACRSARLDERVTRALRLEVVARLDQGQPKCRTRACSITAGAKRFGALSPVPTAVPPRGSSPRRRQARPRAARHRLPPARRSRRAPGRASPASRPSGGYAPPSRRRAFLRCWRRSAVGKVLQAGDQIANDGSNGREVDGRREDVVRTTATR